MHNLCRMADMHHGVLNLIGWDTREAPTYLRQELMRSEVLIGEGFNIHNWPVSSKAARHDLETMVETHRVVPILAYDADGNLIHPQNYRKMLRGALVQVDFHLTHWSIVRRQDGTSAAYSYTADVAYIRVLSEPTTSVTTTKRKIAARIDSSHLEAVAGPSKKKGRK
ncbi:hypothetical protein M405DRAFT_882740 [Rhizopogon salebrosus TDB-379]|nr:hypothetical protein M405DRAFT_882740 [Rhizopogon salebrosus TDB-379]